MSTTKRKDFSSLFLFDLHKNRLEKSRGSPIVPMLRAVRWQLLQDTHCYCGLSAKDIGVAANLRLLSNGFRTGMSEELFGTIKGAWVNENCKLSIRFF